MRHVRRCTRTGCGRSAVATLTYAYADLTAVVGPLASFAEPHSYDLCEGHAVNLTVPRGCVFGMCGCALWSLLPYLALTHLDLGRWGTACC